MFKKILQWLRTVLSGIDQQKYAGVDVSLSGDMTSAIELWSRMYSSETPWAEKNLANIGLPAAIAAEFARLVTLELKVTISGSARADYLTKQFEGFRKKLRGYTEYACALGNEVFKPYPSGKKINIDAVQGDSFVPLGFDSSGALTSAVFVEQITCGKTIYSRFEIHDFTPERYTIHNRAFASTNKDMLGRPISLGEVPEWADIAPDAELTGVEQPLFADFKVPLANPIDRQSPLGVSVYSRAVGLIHQADEQFGRYIWEFAGGELAIDAAEDYLKDDERVEGGKQLPKSRERLFRRHGTADLNFYEVFSPALRDTSLANGFNTILRRIEFNCGLAYGTLSDPQTVEKTAEEIRTSKQRSYVTVHDIQEALQDALDRLIAAMDTYATIYNLTPAGAYTVAYEWDDSILVDSDKERERMRQDCIDGAAQWYEYRMRFYGEDEATAKAMVAKKAAGDNGELFGS